MPTYNIRVPHDLTADELYLEPGDAFRYEDVLWKIESVTPAKDPDTFAVDLRPWPAEVKPAEVKSFP